MTDAIAQQFKSHYYPTFTAGAQNLAPLYKANSTICFEGKVGTGLEQIGPIITGVGQIQFDLTTMRVDSMPSGPNSILVNVSGRLVLAGQTNPLNFNQVFNLAQDGGSYYILNEIMRIATA